MSIQRIIESFCIGMHSLSIIASLCTLTLILVHIRQLVPEVHIILICNTYIALIGASSMTLVVLLYAVTENRDPSVVMREYSCQIRSYANHTFVCAFYYSVALQATFQLCHVVFHNNRVLKSRGVWWLAIIGQWTLASAYILIYLVSGDFEYQPDIRSCWASFTNIRALASGLTCVYCVPLLAMSLMYGCIVLYIRRNPNIQPFEQIPDERNVLVAKRIIITVLIAIGIGLPTGCLFIVCLISGYQAAFSYHIQAVSFAIGFLVECGALAYLTPQVQKLWPSIPPRNRLELAVAYFRLDLLRIAPRSPSLH